MGREERVRDIKKDSFNFIDRNSREITKIGDAIFYFAELGMQEFRTSEYTADALRKAGFKVETGIAGLPPAWMATWGSGKPVIAAHTEADALPKQSQVSGIAEERPIIEGGAPGHVEGHNTNMAVMIGGAVAAKNVMQEKKIRGTIKLYFAPAEEQLISRPYILRDGYFDGVDAIFHPHVGREFSSTYGIRQYSNISVEFIFRGMSAGSGTPWRAKNALDALILMDLGWGLMRQQLQPTQRSSRVILDGGDQPNVIPNFTRVWWYFRDKTFDLARSNFEKARKIAEGAALQTNCTYETKIISACWPTRANRMMGEIIQKNIERVGMPRWSKEEQILAKRLQKKINVPTVGLPKAIKPFQEAQQATSSNDSGCVSWVIPTGRITFPANIPGSVNHQWPAAVPLATSIAHKAEVNGAKVLAGSMLDFFMDKTLLNRVKENFKEEIGGTKYFDIFPKGQKPPVDLNSATMGKWLPLMEKFFIREKVEWK